MLATLRPVMSGHAPILSQRRAPVMRTPTHRPTRGSYVRASVVTVDVNPAGGVIRFPGHWLRQPNDQPLSRTRFRFWAKTLLRRGTISAITGVISRSAPVSCRSTERVNVEPPLVIGSGPPDSAAAGQRPGAPRPPLGRDRGADRVVHAAWLAQDQGCVSAPAEMLEAVGTVRTYATRAPSRDPD